MHLKYVKADIKGVVFLVFFRSLSFGNLINVGMKELLTLSVFEVESTWWCMKMVDALTFKLFQRCLPNYR